MDPITYERITRPQRPSSRGFRLTSRRLSVSKLRSKFGWLLRILNRWRRSIVEIKKSRRSSKGSSNSGAQAARLRSFRRSNSFYAEAIADCLDFIKTSSSFSTPPSTIPTPTF